MPPDPLHTMSSTFHINCNREFRDLKKARGNTACERCRRLKRKCDGLLTCSNCLKSSNPCTYRQASVSNIGSCAYFDDKVDSNDLPRKRKIQKKFSESSNNSRSDGDSNGYTSYDADCKHHEPQSDDDQLQDRSFFTLNALKEKNQNLYISITNLLNDSGEDSYIGVSSIIYKANFIRSMIKLKPAAMKQSESGTSDSNSTFFHGSTDLAQDPPKSLFDPFNRKFVEIYFKLSAQRYFFLEKADVKSLFYKFYPGYEKVAETSRSLMHQETLAYLILAVGCRLEIIATSSQSTQPDYYFQEALQRLASLQSHLAVKDQIRIIMLISVYLFDSYDNSNEFSIRIWGLSGLAIRKITQIGMHRFEVPMLHNARHYELKKRLFWSIYNFEKNLCLILGRSPSFSDLEIDIPYPLNIDCLENYTDAELFFLQKEQQKLQLAEDNHRIIFPLGAQGTYYLIQLTKIREVETKLAKLEAKFWVPISSSDEITTEVHNSLKQGYSAVLDEIENWRNQLSNVPEFMASTNNEIDFEYLLVFYYRAKMLLYSSKIVYDNYATGKELVDLLDDACEASNGVCSSYLSLSKNDMFGYGILTLHSVFLIGILLVYSIDKLKSDDTLKSLISEDRYWKYHNYLRHYSILLYASSHKSKKASSFKSLFEKLLENNIYTSSNEKVDFLPTKSTQNPNVLAQGIDPRSDMLLDDLINDFFKNDLKSHADLFAMPSTGHSH